MTAAQKIFIVVAKLVRSMHCRFATWSFNMVLPKPLMVLSLMSALMMSGCSTPADIIAAPKVIVVSVPWSPTVLSAEADNALKAAEQTVVETRVRRALWTAATEQLALARGAAKIFDSENTLKHAREAIVLCQSGLQQKLLPPVTW